MAAAAAPATAAATAAGAAANAATSTAAATSAAAASPLWPAGPLVGPPTAAAVDPVAVKKPPRRSALRMTPAGIPRGLDEAYVLCTDLPGSDDAFVVK